MDFSLSAKNFPKKHTPKNGVMNIQTVAYNRIAHTIIYTGMDLTLPTAEILSGKNVRAWVSMVSYLKK